MNKHFHELAKIVGQALARRWMEQCKGVGGGDTNRAAAHAPAPPPRRRRMRIQQHK